MSGIAYYVLRSDEVVLLSYRNGSEVAVRVPASDIAAGVLAVESNLGFGSLEKSINFLMSKRIEVIQYLGSSGMSYDAVTNVLAVSLIGSSPNSEVVRAFVAMLVEVLKLRRACRNKSSQDVSARPPATPLPFSLR